jgi:hypothetical protein
MDAARDLDQSRFVEHDGKALALVELTVGVELLLFAVPTVTLSCAGTKDRSSIDTEMVGAAIPRGAEGLAAASVAQPINTEMTKPLVID